MLRNVYLEGELGEKFGHKMTVDVPTVQDVFRLLDANGMKIKEHLVEAVEKEIDYHIDIAGEELEYKEELLLPLEKGDITITPIPKGSKGAFKVIAAIVIIAVAWNLGGAQLFANLAAGAPIGAGGWATIGALMVGSSLLQIGIAEMMMPDPATDNDQESSYLFNGAEQNVIEGDPVPVLYGRLKVPGQPINFEVTNASAASGSNLYFSASGSWQASSGGTPLIVTHQR